MRPLSALVGVTGLLLSSAARAEPAKAPAKIDARVSVCSVTGLGSFDASLRRARPAEEPALRRDRGLCHEKLGHPYPAIDDFRAYLVARPDASDAEDIRARLARLQEQVGQGTGKETEPSSDSAGESRAAIRGGASASVSASGSGAGVEARASGTPPTSATQGDDTEPKKPEDIDEVLAKEKVEDEAAGSPLRLGTGVAFGAFVHIPRFFLGDGATGDFGYAVGGTLRGSLSSSVSLLGEIGYASVGSGGNTSSGGPLFLGGVELRLPLDRYAGDQILLRGGLGYERYTFSGSRVVTDVVVGRFAVGYRHVFGPAFALEALVDGGPAYAIPEIGDGMFRVLVGGSIAAVLAF